MNIKTLQPVRHDEEDIEVGTEMDLPDHQAQALIDVGAAESLDPPAKAKVKSPAAAAKKGANK